MFYSYKGERPDVAPGVFVAPGGRVIGRVKLAAEVSVWYNTVLRGDTSHIEVGEGSNIQDLTVVHCDEDMPAIIGRNVTIGHSCIIHGATIGDNCLIGMGAVVLNRAVIGENSLVAAGSLVTEGKEFPPGSVIMGRPAKVVREVGEKELEMIRHGAAHYRENARAHAAENPSV